MAVLNKKVQAATEYLMVVGFVIVILLPGIYLYVKYSSESKDSVTNAKIDAITNEIIKSAEQVYSYGEGSQTAVSVDFPEGVIMVSFQDREIVFTVINSRGSQSEIAKVASIDLIGDITVIPGTKKINVKSLGNAVSVFVECVDDEIRCGELYECDYYESEGNECIMVCENNRWDLSSVCSDGYICDDSSGDSVCELLGGEQFGG